MKKSLLALLAVGGLSLAACGSPSQDARGTIPAPPTTESTAQVVPAAPQETFPAAPQETVPSLTDREIRERAFLTTLASEGIGLADADALMVGQATCQFFDEGGDADALFLGLALNPEDRIHPGLANKDLPYVVGASIAAFCPEHEGQIK